MKIPEYFAFSATTTKDDDLRAGQDCGVGVSWGRWCPTDFRLSELVCVDIKDIRIIEVGIAFGLTCEVMTTEDDNTGA